MLLGFDRFCMRVTPLTALPLTFATLLLCAATSQARQTEQSPALSPAFEFHSGFWINLHHFLYLQGRIRRSAGESSLAAPAGQEGLPRAVSVADLSPDQLRVWNAAVNAYSADWSSRDLLLNGDMVIINNRLAELENCPDLSSKVRPECQAGLRPDLVAALDEAAPVYRAQWWPEQDRANRAWISDVAPLIRQMGTSLAAQLAEIYRQEWPQGPMRVDVVWAADPLGTYTTLDPMHITIASADPRNQGLAALEILFHGASHALSTGVNQAITRECRQRGKPIPRNLWDALQYYTTRELVRRIYARSSPSGQDSDSASASDVNSMYDQDWSRYRRLLESYWQPYLDGKIGLDTAIARMVAAL
jgi:hypothetical protein